MLKGLLTILALMAISIPAMAASIYLNPPAYPWPPGVGHSNVAWAHVNGFDASGNPIGVCVYYNSRGFAYPMSCGWDLLGNGHLNGPANINEIVYSSVEQEFVLPSGYIARGWLQGTSNGYSVYVEAPFNVRRSILETP